MHFDRDFIRETGVFSFSSKNLHNLQYNILLENVDKDITRFL